MGKSNLQLSLFDETSRQLGGAASFTQRMKDAMLVAIRESSLSRPHIVDAMNALASKVGRKLADGNKRELGEDTLDKWVADIKRGQMPSLYALHIFMEVTGSQEPLRVWLGLFGCEILTTEEKKLAEYGRQIIARRQIAKAVRKLENEILED